MDASTDEEERYLYIFLIMLIFNLIYSDEEEQRKHRQTTHNSAMKNVGQNNYFLDIFYVSFYLQTKSRSASLSDVEKRLFGYVDDDEGNLLVEINHFYSIQNKSIDSTITATGAGSSSTPHLGPKQALTAELSHSTDVCSISN